MKVAVIGSRNIEVEDVGKIKIHRFRGVEDVAPYGVRSNSFVCK